MRIVTTWLSVFRTKSSASEANTDDAVLVWTWSASCRQMETTRMYTNMCSQRPESGSANRLEEPRDNA